MRASGQRRDASLMTALAERTATIRPTCRTAGPGEMTARPTHRTDIQGLRGIAVLLVVFGHAGVGFLRGGYVGVDVFFVLSGFLITGLLLAEARKRGSISLSGFYCRRARRILPAAGVTLLATMLAATFLLNFVRARVAVWDAVAATGFAANLRFARLGTDYFAQSQPPSPVLHFWSLAVEEQFYLVWPALLSLVLFGSWIGRRRHHGFHRGRLLVVVALAGSVSLAWSVWQTRELPQVAYFSPFTRAWELALGAALAIGANASETWHPRWRALVGWLGLAAIATAALIYTESTPFPGTAALLPTLGSALVIWAGIGAPITPMAPGRLLELLPLRYVGDCSYSLYLWHWPLLAIAPLYLGHRLSLPANLALVSAAFVLAIVSYEVVENPIRRARWTGTRTALVFGVSTAVILAGAAASLAAISNERTRFEARAPEPERSSLVPAIHRVSVTSRHTTAEDALPEVVAAVQEALRDDPLPAGLTPPVEHVGAVPPPYVLPRGCVPVAASNDSSSLVCRIGRTTSRRTLVLIGDSHAQMWLPAVLQLAERDGWRVIPLLRPGCTPDTWVDAHGLGACRPWFRWAARQVRLLRPQLTLVGGAVGATTGDTARAAVHGLLTMIRELRPASRRIVTIGDPEGLIRNPVDCLLARHASMGTCTTTWPAWRLEPYDRVAAGAKKLGSGFIDNRGWFCFERHCPTVIGHIIAYRDWHHITVSYALHLAPTFRSALRQLHVS